MELPATVYRYDARDAALYALGVGAPADPLDQDELKFVYELSERGFQVLPTFAAIFSRDLIAQLLRGDFAGIQYDPMMLVHGEQSLELLQPLPAAATVESRHRIADIQDKGSGLLMSIDVRSCDERGEGLAAARTSVFIRGLGGFGGRRGQSARLEAPAGSPDIVHAEKTLPSQALFYRLAGDANPLHADPIMAARGAYDKPILHGLCTLGFAARALLKHCGGNQAASLGAIQARFSGHVFPGETLVTEIWRNAGGEVRFRTKTQERGGLVLSQARATLRA